MADLNVFDFMITDEGEVMLVMYARNIPPHENPGAVLYPENHIIELYRSDTEAMTLEDVDDDVFKNLENETELLVCEINPENANDTEEAEIVYAYNAEIIRDLEELRQEIARQEAAEAES